MLNFSDLCDDIKDVIMLIERNVYKNEDDDVGYIESIFDSGNILKTTYFPQQHRLYIAFKRGHTYSYSNVTPEKYEEFENAESHGKFFHKEINDKNKYPYRKEFTLYPNEVSDLYEIVEKHKKDDDGEEDE